MSYTGKYLPLKNYLENSSKLREEVSYEDIEAILDFTLPNSAYIHEAWWNNGGHSQSDSWLEAGWKVDDVDLRNKIVFTKNNCSKDIILKTSETTEIKEKEPICKIFGCSLEDLKENIIMITQQSGCVIRSDQISIDDKGMPHTPGSLNGKMGIYIFIWNDIFLKIGKANSYSNARFQSQHYSPKSSKSNLSKSILNDAEMNKLNLSLDTVGDWIKKNTRRVDIFLDKSLGVFVLNFIEAFLQLKYMPKYEGFKNQRNTD
jgi:hypothetical protein